MKESDYTYHYPHNLNEKPTLWYWTIRNVIIIAGSLAGSLVSIVWWSLFLPAVCTVIFALLTFRVGDTTIYDYSKLLCKYVVFDKLILQYDEGGNPTMPRKNTCDKELNISNITDEAMHLFSYNQKQIYLFLKPTNVAVLPTEFMRTKIELLANSIKSVSENYITIEILCLNSTQSFEENKEYLNERIHTEKNIQLRQLLQKDLIELETIKLQAAANREFVMILNFYQQSQNTINNLVNRVVSTLNEGGFSPKLAKKEDYKRLAAIYYEQRLDVEDLVEYDGEQFVGGNKNEIAIN